jgi:ring-1,2-phenylacetyl-CoA epoxidase subunit PaaD
MSITVDNIYQWLEEVKDPEIPVLSIVDLGVISEVQLGANAVKIEMTPTFVGCPAIDMMKDDIYTVLKKHGLDDVEIEVNFKKPWNSDKISEKGRLALKQFGLAPPPSGDFVEDIDILEHAICPRCNGDDTQLKNTFGPTLCRSIHYCNQCHEAFEQFKPIS